MEMQKAGFFIHQKSYFWRLRADNWNLTGYASFDFDTGDDMQVNLTQDSVPHSGRGILLAIGGSSALPSRQTRRPTTDSSLVGMVEKGHGTEALCAFLGLVQIDLMARVVALNLRTPHNGVVRRRNGARNAWQIGEIRQLIPLWECNLSSPAIASRLARSPGAVRAKARWLGLARRPRASLVSQPSLLPDPDQAGKGQASPGEPMRKRTRWTNDYYGLVIDRFLAYQHYEGIARDLGLTPAQVRSKFMLLGLPGNRDRALQTMEYRPDTQEAVALRAKYIKRICPELGQLYVTLRGSRSLYCPAYLATEQYRYRAAYMGENNSVSHLC